MPPAQPGRPESPASPSTGEADGSRVRVRRQPADASAPEETRARPAPVEGRLAWLLPLMPACRDACALIEAAIGPQPGQVGDGTVVKEGFSPDLDNLRLASKDAREYIARMESVERDRTGIRNLKV
ncbi:MAG: hypothetical protein HY681_01885, partial [Chloroflexi bacterium]|nr:hypothetical protein [Chloroflexota bacterium]